MKSLIRRQFSKAEKRAMETEIKKQLAEWDKNNEIEIDAMVLWVLHEKFGFGEKRLRAFYDSFKPLLQNLVDKYHLDSEDELWLCTYKLKDELGIDLEEWRKED